MSVRDETGRRRFPHQPFAVESFLEAIERAVTKARARVMEKMRAGSVAELVRLADRIERTAR